MDDHPRTMPFVRPDLDAIRRAGWHVVSLIGDYCVAFRDGRDVTFVWRNDAWQQLTEGLRKAG
jgi:hypothetical protein